MTHRTSEYPLCRHTRTNGRRCQAPALSTSAFCSHHQRLRRTRRTTITVAPATQAVVRYEPPRMDSRSAILVAIDRVKTAIDEGRVGPVQGKLMLRTLRLARENARRNLKESRS